MDKNRLKQELPALALRVRDGNEKCIAAWLRVADYKDDNLYEDGLAKISKATKLLIPMCDRLIEIQRALDPAGKSQCLYIMDGKKIKKCEQPMFTSGGKVVDTWCYICTSDHPFWKEEWPEFTQAEAKAVAEKKTPGKTQNASISLF